MPIKCALQINPVDQERFHELDRLVMGHAFDIHNELGRFCDESVFQNELAYRCEDSGLKVTREVRLFVTHRNFSKFYFIDMLVENGALYELKCAESITGEHKKQAIHYLLLAGLNHGKLINFRGSSVESQFVSKKIINLIGQRWKSTQPA